MARVRYDLPRRWRQRFCRPLRLRLPLREALRPAMFEPILGLVVALALAGYLLFTLLKPEKF